MKKIFIILSLIILSYCDKDKDNVLDFSNLEGILVINEINYHSSDDFNTGDWVELYNNTDELLDISNWIFKDENDSHIFTFSENTILSSGEYIVLCSDTSFFTSFFHNVNNFIGNLGFGFSGNGEQLRFFNSEYELVDSINDNSIAENWTFSNGNGSPGQSNN